MIKNSKGAWLFLLIFSVFAFVSCRDDDSFINDGNFPGGAGVQSDTARCMTLVYMIAENSLANYAEDDFEEILMAAVDVPDDCRMLAFVDDRGMPYISRFYNRNGVAQCDTVYRFEDDFCASDTAEMREVLDLILEKYPAKSLNLILWSHGSGWVRESRSVAPNRIIGIDNGNNSYSNTSVKSIEIEELAGLLASLPVDVQMVMFDACFMQNAEVAYALRNSCKWILASPAEIPGPGAPYHKMIGSFFSYPFDVEAVMNAYYEEYANMTMGVVLSVVDCAAVDALAESTAMLVPKYFSVDADCDYNKVFSYLSGGSVTETRAYYPDYFDMNSAMQEFASAADFYIWRMAFEAAVPFKCASRSWYSAVHGTYYVVDRSSYCGMAMYLPQNDAKFDKYNQEFRTTEWYSVAGWDVAGW